MKKYFYNSNDLGLKEFFEDQEYFKEEFKRVFGIINENKIAA